MDFTIYFTLAAAVNRTVEVIKPLVKRYNFEQNVYDALIQLIAIALGILVVSVAKVNIVNAFFPVVPEYLAFLVTGALVGLGADVLNGVIDLLYSWQRPAPAKS
jgi:hypothetical protein